MPGKNYDRGVLDNDGESSGSVIYLRSGRDSDLDSRFLNKELSWLQFNKRVLEESYRSDYPLLERVRFLSISGRNLDEFCMIRVAGLYSQLRSGVSGLSIDGLSPGSQLNFIRDEISCLLSRQSVIWSELLSLLLSSGIEFLSLDSLSASDLSWLDCHFMDHIFPIITPISIDPAHPFPFIPNRGLAIVFELYHEKMGRRMNALVQIPSTVPRFIRLPCLSDMTIRFVSIDSVIVHFVDRLFSGYDLLARGFFRIIRDSDIEIEEEADDLVRVFESALKRRRRGSVIYMEVDGLMPIHLRKFISENLRVGDETIFEVSDFLGFCDVDQMIADERDDLLFSNYTARFPERIRDFNGDCFAAIRKKDIIVHHPYESFDVVVRFLEQAARDPDVVAIKQTLYRTSDDSPIVEALVSAAEAGKSVTALVELKARFHEAANINLARRLERAGAQVVFGFMELKTHAKLSLVVRREGDILRSYVHYGTGNYHPATARIYTDLSFFTASASYGRDTALLFNYLSGYGEPRNLEKLVISPLSLREVLLSHIEDEISHARSGRPGMIWMKLNSLAERGFIEALYRASCAGVKIRLIVRGICCLRPGISGLSENIIVTSIIGRFLEHARIYCFGCGHGLPSEDARVYISSADLMPRNLFHRVETLVPIENSTVHEQVLEQIMCANIRDNRQSWRLGSNGDYSRVSGGADRFNAHDYFMTNPSLSGRGTAFRTEDFLYEIGDIPS